MAGLLSLCCRKTAFLSPRRTHPSTQRSDPAQDPANTGSSQPESWLGAVWPWPSTLPQLSHLLNGDTTGPISRVDSMKRVNAQVAPCTAVPTSCSMEKPGKRTRGRVLQSATREHRVLVLCCHQPEAPGDPNQSPSPSDSALSISLCCSVRPSVALSPAYLVPSLMSTSYQCDGFQD